VVDCFQQTYKEQGMVGFYRGYFEHVTYIIPNALVTYEIFDKLYALCSSRIFNISKFTRKNLTVFAAGTSHSLSRLLFYPWIKYVKMKQISDENETTLYAGASISMMNVFMTTVIGIYTHQILVALVQ
jgi:hypothetical protein